MISKLANHFKAILIITLGIYIFDKTRMFVYGYEILWDINREIKLLAIYLLYSTVLGLANFWVVDFASKRYSWKEEPKKRAILGIVGSLLVSMIAVFVLRLFTVLIIENNSWAYFVENERAGTYFFSLLITSVVVLLLYVIHFYKAITEKEITAHKTIAKTEIAKYESLKSQIDPHFLFNSLNVLTSLIEENPEQAERFTTKLSKVYRYVLEQKEKSLISLQEELDFARVYMELLKMRFEDAVSFEMPKDLSNPDFKIVPLSLQLLLENAVKHNTITKDKPLTIRIKESNGNLIVLNNYNQKKVLKKETGIGLQNIIERYALLTERTVSIEKNEETFLVSLPLLTQKTRIMKTINTSEEKKYYQAKERVDKMKEFYANLVSYIGVNTFLIFVNYYTGWGHKWFIYPLIGWGIGVMFHYFEAFGYYPFLGKNWEEKKIKELMEEDEKEMWK